MVKVSVIVPVYNVEKYLRQCLDSICAQTLSDIEIICVNDGSTDSSLEILNEYKEADERFLVISQENQYASVARNNGMKHATGEYLVFWDSDDFFEETALEKMYEQAKKCDADVCVCGANRYFEEQDMLVKASIYVREEYVPAEVFNIKTNPDYILNFTNESGWNKMFRRSFMEEKNIDFLPVRNGEDVYMVMRALCLAGSITTVGERLVTYRVNQKSNLVGTMYKTPLDPFIAWEKTAKSLKEAEVFPERSFVNKCISSMIYLLRNLSNRQAFDEAVAYIKEHVLEETGIRADREEGFYEKEMHRVSAVHLCNDSADELLMYLAYSAYLEMTSKSGQVAYKNDRIRQMKDRIERLKTTLELKNSKLEEVRFRLSETQKRLREARRQQKAARKDWHKAQKELKDLRGSTSYKVGRIFTWLPRKLRGQK